MMFTIKKEEDECKIPLDIKEEEIENYLVAKEFITKESEETNQNMLKEMDFKEECINFTIKKEEDECKIPFDIKEEEVENHLISKRDRTHHGPLFEKLNENIVKKKCQAVKLMDTNGIECLICKLINHSFSSKTFEQKKEIRNAGRPTPELPNLLQVKSKYTRRFHVSKYDNVKWLAGCCERSAVFCWSCLLFSTEKNVWTKEGYKDLENISHAIKRHEISRVHIRSTISFATFGQFRNSLDMLLNEKKTLEITEHNRKVNQNRKIVGRLIDAVCLIGKLGLPFSCHNEKEDSVNKVFREIVQHTAAYDDLLSSHLEMSSVFSGLSTHIQNDLIDAVGVTVINEIKQEIQNTKFVSIMIDETADISMKEHLSIVFRYVQEGNVRERFITFKDVSSDRTAEALEQLVLEVLDEFHCSNKLVAQTYDGSAVVSSSLNGLQAKIKEKIPSALFVHSNAHNLNLVLSQCISRVNECKKFFGSLEELVSFFSKSSKRSNTLHEIVKRRLPHVAPTRWSFHSRIINVVKEQTLDLVELFTVMQSHPEIWDTKSVFFAESFKHQLTDFEFLFLLHILDKIFSFTDVLYNLLQTKSYDIAYCTGKIEETSLNIRKMRANFNIYVKEITGNNNEGKQMRFQENESNHDKLRRVFYEVIDTITLQLYDRFESLPQLLFVELLNPLKYSEYSRKFPDGLYKNLISSYSCYFDHIRLKNELLVVYSSEEFKNKFPHEIMKFLNKNNLESAMPELKNLAELITTIPSTSVSCEQSFSALKRIKTYLRNMGQNKLAYLALLNIEKELLQKLQSTRNFHNIIINKFASIPQSIELTYK